MRFPREPDYAGIVVVLFAIMIVFVVVADVGTAAFGDRTASENEARFVSGVIGVAIGVVSTYVGGNWRARQRTRSLYQETKRVRGVEEGGVQQEQGGGDQQRGGEGTSSPFSDGE
jgi:hypothetical protein